MIPSWVSHMMRRWRLEHVTPHGCRGLVLNKHVGAWNRISGHGGGVNYHFLHPIRLIEHTTCFFGKVPAIGG